MVHIYLGKTLNTFGNQHRSSLNMHILTQLLFFFFILIIPVALFFQARAVKFGSVEALNTLINKNPGFMMIAKF